MTDNMDRIERRIAQAMEGILRERDGVARQAMWDCEDGWYVVYTTGRIVGGPHDGKFLTLLYKPVGQGARTKPSEWICVKKVQSATRKGARARAERWFYQHSPKTKERHMREPSPQRMEET